LIQHNVAHSKDRISATQYAFMQLKVFFFGSFTTMEEFGPFPCVEGKNCGSEEVKRGLTRRATFTVLKGQ
jgi:hypothetical protein